MEFAIVRFLDEDDAPGIVATNWISRGKNTCFFPNVKSEEKKNRLLVAREVPNSTWLECPVKVLKEFANYQAARSLLTEAELTSNLESEKECAAKPRRRVKRIIRLPGEDSSSSEEEGNFKRSKFAYPSPPPFASPVQNLNVSSRSNAGAYPSPPPISSPVRSLNVSSRSNVDIQGFGQEIEALKANQKAVWSVLEDFKDTLARIEQKIDSLTKTVATRSSERPLHSMQNEEDISFIASLPVGLETFQRFNEKLLEKEFYQRLVKICMSFGGRDAKGLVSNVLRKLLTDDVGETFSLTGKATKCGAKKSFEKTEIYKVVLEVVYRSFNVKENITREAISDWLMQSKFRKARREKRKSAASSDTVCEDTPEFLDFLSQTNFNKHH